MGKRKSATAGAKTKAKKRNKLQSVDEEEGERLKNWSLYLQGMQEEAATQTKHDMAATLKRAQLGIIQRYGMIFDVNGGLVRLKQVVEDHAKEELPSGDGSEEFMLGMLHWEGVLVEQNNKRSAELLRAGVEKGNPDSMVAWGFLLLLERQDERPDPPFLSLPEDEGAVELFRQAAEKGHVTAQYQMGEISVNHGHMEKAALYLKAATGGGHPEAPFIWARELEKGKLGEEEGEKRQEKAMELYHLAAQRSSPEANFHLSRCYFYGEGGVEVNKSLAAAYIRIATGLGCAEAQYILATTFEKGLWDDAIELSPDQVLRLYEEAAEQGDPGAATRMGLLHWIGAFGVEGDDDKAVEFFAIGAEQENSEAILRLGEAFMLGRGTKKDSKKAAALLRRVAHEEGEPLAYLLLGELFEKGEGVEKDADEASRLFEKAVACYVPHAFYRLRQLHRRGEGWQGITEEMVNYYDGFIQKFEENEYMHLSDKTALTVLKAHPVFFCSTSQKRSLINCEFLSFFAF